MAQKPLTPLELQIARAYIRLRKLEFRLMIRLAKALTKDGTPNAGGE